MLRGIAALAVTIFHFTSGLSTTFWLGKVGRFGFVGVEMFFIISGFVIPYALYKRSYVLKDWSNFLLRRVIRIEPPYLVCIILTILLNLLSTLSPLYKGGAFQLNISSILLHIGYLVPFFKETWLSPVFWTLAIEFQFYILAALIFPLIVSKKNYLKILILVIFLSSYCLIPSGNFIFHYSSFFVLGIVLFYQKCNFLKKEYAHVINVALLALIYYQFSTVILIASLITSGAITFLTNWENKGLLFLGTISYSLYLIHVPVGGRIINLAKNFITSNNGSALIILVALMVTLVTSYIFYRIVELPSLKLERTLAKKVK